MSRSQRRRRGRPYQPMPERRVSWAARIFAFVIAASLLLGTLAFVLGGS